MRTCLLYVSIAIAAGLVFVNIYNYLVDVQSWGSEIPASIVASRSYFKLYNPGLFFRVFSPLNQVVALVCLILFWKRAPFLRGTLAAALLLYVVANAVTFVYFHPRNSILFDQTSTLDRDILERTWNEWRRMDWMRTGMVIAGMVLSMISLHGSYRRPSAS